MSNSKSKTTVDLLIMGDDGEMKNEAREGYRFDVTEFGVTFEFFMHRDESHWWLSEVRTGRLLYKTLDTKKVIIETYFRDREPESCLRFIKHVNPLILSRNELTGSNYELYDATKVEEAIEQFNYSL